MRWWCLLAAKVAALAASHLVLIFWINRWIPNSTLGLHLGYSFAVLGADMAVFVAGYFFWLDQKLRCRDCAARLRMPVATGNWSRAMLFAPPQLEWICPYGHGTMRHTEVQLSGVQADRWQKNDEDFWKAFEDAWRKD